MSITLADVVTLLHRPLLSLLWTKDLTALYVSCGHSLPEDVRFEYRDYLAMQELDLLAVNNSCHFGAKCELDWYQLTPVEIEGALEDFECPCFKTVKYSEYPRYEPPDILPLLRILDAPAKLLEAGRLQLIASHTNVVFSTIMLTNIIANQSEMCLLVLDTTIMQVI
ncbi:hypothetical protein PF011_g27237 [Phytophthora fragariae]|uniref:Uncharacterized protein n=1 Tax=Phytophthora fragariae TaxID=53985 RepID=A0A6A3HEB3_9STRA|nr:hypothetical protein PF011_g27237 [Phytophthora fragariae]